MFQKQPMMRKVLYSLVPIVLWSVYLYGWRSIAIILLSVVSGTLTEYLFLKYIDPKKKVTEAVLVSCVLYALSLPPALPLLMAPVGIVLAVILAKLAFGGFGRNLFNPAISGRALMYLIFSGPMTAKWYEPGNFGLNYDGVTSSTPLQTLRSSGEAGLESLQQINWNDFLFGFRGSSIGEGSVLLIVLAAVYLLYTKTANWRLMLSGLIGFAVPSLILSPMVLDVNVLAPSIDVMHSLVLGSFLFVCVFMLTDPVSAPKKRPSLWYYGFIFGIVTVLVRYFAPSFPEGTTFGILMANVFASFLDELFPNAPNAMAPLKKKKTVSKQIPKQVAATAGT